MFLGPRYFGNLVQAVYKPNGQYCKEVVLKC